MPKSHTPVTPSKSPQPPRLRQLIQQVHALELEPASAADIVGALDWLATFLENRSLYHRKQQLKNKIFKQLCAEHGLIESAEKLANTAEFDEVANQQPDINDLAELLEAKNGDR